MDPVDDLADIDLTDLDPSELPLRDIHLPEPISWWPLAPGWWLVAAVVLTALVVGWLWWRYRKQTSISDDYLQRLERIELTYAKQGDHHRLARDLSILMRRTMISVDPEITPAVIGEAWVTAWSSRLPADKFDVDELTRALTVAPYRAAESFDGGALIGAVREALTRLNQGGETPLGNGARG